MTTLKTLTVSDLAALLGRSVATLKSDVSRRPETLPPRLVVPGTKAVMWLEADVQEWLESLRRPAVRRPVMRGRK